MLVRELIAFLQTGNDSAMVVVFDDFGRPHEVDKYAFELTDQKDGSYTTSPPPDCQFLAIEVPDVPRVCN